MAVQCSAEIQLREKPNKIDRVHPAEFGKFNNVDPPLARLALGHEGRISAQFASNLYLRQA
jgi:hypothetical protein